MIDTGQAHLGTPICVHACTVWPAIAPIRPQYYMQQVPPYCPACRAATAGDVQALRSGPGLITDQMLTFLQRRGVIDKDLQFRLMLQELVA